MTTLRSKVDGDKVEQFKVWEKIKKVIKKKFWYMRVDLTPFPYKGVE